MLELKYNRYIKIDNNIKLQDYFGFELDNLYILLRDVFHSMSLNRADFRSNQSAKDFIDKYYGVGKLLKSTPIKENVKDNIKKFLDILINNVLNNFLLYFQIQKKILRQFSIEKAKVVIFQTSFFAQKNFFSTGQFTICA